MSQASNATVVGVACSDNSFQPHAGPSCRGGFDFSLLFEETIFTIPLQCILLVVVPFRIFQLLRKDIQVGASILRPLKVVRLHLSLEPLRLCLVTLHHITPTATRISGLNPPLLLNHKAGTTTTTNVLFADVPTCIDSPAKRAPHPLGQQLRRQVHAHKVLHHGRRSGVWSDNRCPAVVMARTRSIEAAVFRSFHVLLLLRPPRSTTNKNPMAVGRTPHYSHFTDFESSCPNRLVHARIYQQEGRPVEE